ncbi:hypothetical protein NM208_g16699 [Fusarium decemcellulare]|uniref:Uncharacterized protein n=1 Tax=Fusarium decemcellulare TaxID=57161 RepID=A0ACC1RC04_9HYPO|nr:hypothetical protein NM208_g16699 [Fusarium decemcellulare]
MGWRKRSFETKPTVSSGCLSTRLVNCLVEEEEEDACSTARKPAELWPTSAKGPSRPSMELMYQQGCMSFVSAQGTNKRAAETALSDGLLLRNGPVMFQIAHEHEGLWTVRVALPELSMIHCGNSKPKLSRTGD